MGKTKLERILEDMVISAVRSAAPSQKAGIKFPFKNWLDIVKSKR